jgi:hypothetical protein
MQNLKQNSMVLAKIDALQNHDPSPVESKLGEADWVPALPNLSSGSTHTKHDGRGGGKFYSRPGIAARTVIGMEIQAADSRELVQEALPPSS